MLSWKVIFLVVKFFERVRRWAELVLLIITSHANLKFKLKEEVSLFPKPLIESDNSMNDKEGVSHLS